MTYIKWAILLGSFAIVAFVAFMFTLQFKDLQDLFFYLNDWPSWIMLFLLLIAIKGILTWIFQWEMRTLK